jgi:hypothetical protein
MPVEVEALNALREEIQITRVDSGVPEPGKPIRVGLQTPLHGLQVLDALPGLDVPIPTPVTVKVEWYVEDENHQPVDARPLQGATALETDLLVPVPFVELTGKLVEQPFEKYYVGARVQLSVGDVTTAFEELPELEVSLPAVPIPTLAAFFPDDDYMTRTNQGGCLLVVPARSPLKSTTELLIVLERLRTAVDNLRTVLSLAALILGVRELVEAVPRAQIANFAVTDRIRHLNNIPVVRRTWRDDPDWDDQIHSMIFIGPPGTTLTCYSDKGFDTNEGAFRLTLDDDKASMIRGLATDSPKPHPASTIDIMVPDSDGFHDSMSSIEFSPRAG